MGTCRPSVWLQGAGQMLVHPEAAIELLFVAATLVPAV